jgi:hypothetical protein
MYRSSAGGGLSTKFIATVHTVKSNKCSNENGAGQKTYRALGNENNAIRQISYHALQHEKALNESAHFDIVF